MNKHIDLRIETIACGQANVYLLKNDKTAMLIDTGTSAYRDKVLGRCQNANVRLIVLTHGHFDHCQNSAYLAHKLNCAVGIAEEDKELLTEHRKRKVFGKGAWGRFYAWASNHNIRTKNIEAVEPDIMLKDGMSLSEYGIDGKIIGLAGHTKGSIGVLLPSGELFVGDAMQNIFVPAAALCYEDALQAKESYERIRKMNVAKLFFGHGRSIEENVKVKTI